MRILTSLFLAQGWQVKASDVHGMAQRGGSVETHCVEEEMSTLPSFPSSRPI
jgi:Pyruvate/2-oxoacid:ferredoxin oxidoreductase gamma subunit